MRADSLGIIHSVYQGNDRALDILLKHSRAVAGKAMEIARSAGHLEPDLNFIEEAALLHDIGIIRTDAPRLGCGGYLPYICHGVEGRRILVEMGLNAHALVCERHVGVGLTAGDINKHGFPLPQYDMVPVSTEEKIVCLADKFFSKPGDNGERTLSEVRASIASYGEEKARALESMIALLIPEHDRNEL